MNSIYSLIDQHFSAIIGVIGTLLGVVFGSLLNRISRCGSVKFYINNTCIELSEFENISYIFKIIDVFKNEQDKIQIGRASCRERV